MKRIRVYQVDSFTNVKFRGNPAGVVLNADCLTDSEMLQLARELNNSETAFVLCPDGSDHDVRIRFFTPKMEVPMCGHATVAAHFVRAHENNLNTCTVIQKIGAGILPVEINWDGRNYSIMMTQGAIEFHDPLPTETSKQVLSALGLTERDLIGQCPIQIVSTGNSKVIIPIASRNKLNSLAPNLQELSRLSQSIQSNGYFVFTMDTIARDVLTHGRMFAPAVGINEDPVTGNAHGPLGAYLIKHGFVKPEGSIFSFTGEQGDAIGRSGFVEVQIVTEQGNPTQAKIGGQAVVVFNTVIEF